MHVLGARFGTTQAALTALRELRARFALGEHDAEVLPLGSTQYEAPTSDVILAARLRPELVSDVVAMLEDLGGSVVVARSEWQGSPPPVEPAAGPPRSRGSRLREEDAGRAGGGRSMRDRVEAMGLLPEGRDPATYPRPYWLRSSPRNRRRT